jgi:CubicO group peptidase (beta-lactamase class C family)
MKAAQRLLPPVLLLIFLNQIAFMGATARRRNLDPPPNVSAALYAYFEKAAGLGFSGAVLVAKDGRPLLRNGYGWADLRRRIPIRPDTIFDIGSGVKSFTATAIMQLEAQGKLETSDPITKYFPDVPPDKTTATLHHLLTHTSGLSFDYFYDEATPAQRAIMRDRDKYVRSVLSYPLAFRPGEGRLYSNTGFSLLAIIVEDLSGQPYEQYVAEHLFKPAGMTETGYYIPRNLQRVARGYNDGDIDYGYPWETQWENRKPLWDLKGNGGMMTTLDDLHKWLTAIKGEKIVSQQAKDKMFKVHYQRGDQGYGWFVAETNGHSFVWSGGDAVPYGWNVEFRWYAKDDLMAVVLTNRRIRAGSIRRYAMPNLVDIVLFNKPPPIPVFAKVNSTRLRRLEGVYKLESGAVFRVKATESQTGDGKTKPVLMISGVGQQAIDLLFSGNQLPGLTKLSLELNEKTKAYIEALHKNDLTALKLIPSEESSLEEALKSWNDFVKRNGDLETVEVLGTSPLNQPGVQTFVRLKFKNTAGVYHVTWRDQKLHVQNEDRLQPKITGFLRRSFVTHPLNLPFLPQSNADFATYDPFKGRTIKIRFDNEKLIVHTKDGDVVARKL